MTVTGRTSGPEGTVAALDSSHGDALVRLLAGLLDGDRTFIEEDVKSSSWR